MYRLCYEKAIIPTVKSEEIPVDFISDVDTLMQVNNVILRRLRTYNHIKYIETAYNDFISFKKTVSGPAIGTDIELEVKARSFFLELEIFLDHWNKYISRRGKKEEFKHVFEKATHDAFDSSDDYAMAAMLRNYIAHSSEVIQGKFWGGNNVYDVGCSKDMLLADDTFNKTKKAIIARQPAQFISLTPIMRGALEKLREIHKIFMDFDFSEEDVDAAKVVNEAISAIKEAGLESRHFRFVNSAKRPLTTYTAEGNPIETVWATEYHDFNWQDYEELLHYLLYEYRPNNCEQSQNNETSAEKGKSP